jgi:hypothetical protein
MMLAAIGGLSLKHWHRRVMLAANRLAHVNRFFHFECSEIPSAELALRYCWQHMRAAE